MPLIITIVFLSFGAPGVPGSGIVCPGIVPNTLGVPVEAMGLIMGIYPFPDIFNTMSDMTGGAAAALIAANSENLLDRDIYYRKG